ncbi:MAG: DUF6402 family protein [Bacteroidales bacterium]|nr:DUF6402 family protein [Bacteroidales bacterium]
MKLSQSSGSILNGKYMYVIDEADNIIIGTRANGISPFNGKAPHPTLIGGANPTVKTAGIIEFRGGKIYPLNDLKNTVYEVGDVISWNANTDITNYSTTQIIGVEDSEDLSPWVGAFAALSLRHFFNGEVIKNNADTLEIEVDKIVLRIIDGFNFINDGNNDQRLGTWEHNIFSPVKPKIELFGGIRNNNLNDFYNNYGLGLDFSITFAYNFHLIFNKIIYLKQNNSIIYKKE